MWCHCCHVGGQKQYIFSPLGSKIYFHAKLFHCFSHPTWLPWKPSIEMFSGKVRIYHLLFTLVNMTHLSSVDDNSVYHSKMSPCKCIYRFTNIKYFATVNVSCVNTRKSMLKLVEQPSFRNVCHTHMECQTFEKSINNWQIGGQTAIHLSLNFGFFKCLKFHMCLANSSETLLFY